MAINTDQKLVRLVSQAWLPPLRPGVLDDLLERYINNEHPLSRQVRTSRKTALRVVEARLTWTAGCLPFTPAEVIQIAEEGGSR